VGSFYYPGPGLMPFCLGTGLVAVSLILLFRTLLKLKREKAPLQAKKAAVNYKRVVGVVVVLLVYALLLERVGYLIVTPFLLFLLFKIAGSGKSSATFASVSTVLITYFFFTYLGLRFPPGILKHLGF
jgi:hypothetical protein